MTFGVCSNYECGKENVYLLKDLCELCYIKQKNKQWREDHPGYAKEANLRQQSLLRHYTFKGDGPAMNAIYKECRKLCKLGYDVVIDHWTPLQGETVCGLHCSWNLQIITRGENIRKGNYFNDWE